MTKKFIIMLSVSALIVIVGVALYFSHNVNFDKVDDISVQNPNLLEHSVIVESFDGEHIIEYELLGKTLKKIEFNDRAKFLYLELDGTDSGQMTIRIPRSLMDDNPIEQDKIYENWPRTEITEEKNSEFRQLSFSIPSDKNSLNLYHKKTVNFDKDYGMAITFHPKYLAGKVQPMDKFASQVSNAALANVPKLQDSMNILLSFSDRMENEFIETHNIENRLGNYRIINSGPTTLVLHSFIDNTKEYDFYQQWAYDNLELVPLYDQPDHFYIDYKGEVFELKFENLDLDVYN